MNRFSLRRMILLVACCAVVVAIATPGLRTPIGRAPVWLGPVAVFFLPFLAWFILSGPQAGWIRFGKGVASALGGMAFGVLFFESPLPGALVGLLAGGILSRTRSLPRERRQKAVTLCCLVMAIIVFASAAFTWRHHLAKYEIRRSGGKVYWRVRHLPVLHHRSQMVANALGPYLVPSDTYASFHDATSRGVAFRKQDFERLLPHLKSVHGLAYVNVSCRSFGDDEVEQLACLTSLTGLSLVDTRVTDAGIRSLSGLKQLTWLNLEGSSVTDGVVQPLRSLPALRFLGLGGTRITDDGIRALGQLPSLEETIVPESGVTRGAVSDLKKTVRSVLRGD